MRAEKEIREEREDIFSFWEDVVNVDKKGNEFVTEDKLDETTLVALEALVIELQGKIDIANAKIQLICQVN